MAELSDVIQQLKENNESQLDTMAAVDSLANVISKQFVRQNKDMLETKREAGVTKAKAASSAPSTQNVTNNIDGGPFGLGALAFGLGKLISGVGNLS